MEKKRHACLSQFARAHGSPQLARRPRTVTHPRVSRQCRRRRLAASSCRLTAPASRGRSTRRPRLQQVATPPRVSTPRPPTVAAFCANGCSSRVDAPSWFLHAATRVAASCANGCSSRALTWQKIGGAGSSSPCSQLPCADVVASRVAGPSKLGADVVASRVASPSKPGASSSSPPCWSQQTAARCSNFARRFQLVATLVPAPPARGCSFARWMQLHTARLQLAVGRASLDAAPPTGGCSFRSRRL